MDSSTLNQRLLALNRPMVFTNGVFDILHRGHASYLAQARDFGASLVVGVNSDASAKEMIDQLIHKRIGWLC
jgi:cytidyltransferase-like protein